LRRIAAANHPEGDLEAMLLAIFVALLHRYSGEDDLPVGVVIHARSQRENSQLIGCFVDHQVMRTRFSTGLTVGALHEQTLANRARAAQHSELSLQTILEECLEPGASNGQLDQTNHRDLFQAVFSMRSSPPPVLRFSNIVLTPLEITEPILSCDLALSVIPDGEGLVARLVHHREAASSAFLDFMSRHFVKTLAAAVEAPNLPVDEVPMMEADEYRLVTVGWN
jgi:non-ribosomal peptide synthetase component F